ncbi:MAG TPA: NAD(P)/FAD-dependent oxidoreductase [Steroidobacteraceae bacterium]|nr:NAD(P)/FAD-dependent oxidoreductase [Steroidobacteraceae bacterium]
MSGVEAGGGSSGSGLAGGGAAGRGLIAAGGRKYDCVVIGGGHNGLVCATYLARGGRSVLVVEAANRVGGAAVTREFVSDFRVSACAHLLHLMPESLVRELSLGAHGLRLVAERMPTTALAVDGAPLLIDAENTDALDARSPADAEAFPTYAALLRRLSAALQPLFETTPPRLGTDSWQDRFALARLGLRLRSMGRRDMRELLRIGGMCVQDLLDDYFETPLLKGALGFDAVLGSNFGPRSPGSVFTLLYRMAAAGAAGGSLALPEGGLGALSDALAKAAIDAGVVIRTEAPVERILVEEDRAAGVVLQSGEQVFASAVISSADPKTTFLRLLGSEHLDTGFVRRVKHLRARGLTAKLHLALDRLPRFTGLDASALRGRMLFAPSLEYVERAFNHAKYGEFSAAPILEITVPSVVDSTLAPAGKHVLSAVVQYVPYPLAGGGWEEGKGGLTNLLIEMLDEHAPGLRESVRAAELLTPLDIEREFRISGGHWHHAELALDQFLMVRPVPGTAQYRTPLEGLFLCGAGAHPGGGVMGVAGRNAAREVMKSGMAAQGKAA